MSGTKQHYVYLLENKVNGMYYIGVRSCKGTIWDDAYMGSSKHMTQEDKDNCNKIVLKRFDSRKDAVAYEVEMHDKFDVANNAMFYNKAKQTTTGFDTGGVKVEHSKEHKEYLSKARREYNKKYGNPGTSASEETRKKLSEAGRRWYQYNESSHKGRKLTEEHKKKIGPTGRTHSEETRAKIKTTHKKNATKHKGFKPWWYEIDGVRTEVYDETPRQFSEKMGVNYDVVKDRFREVYKGKPKQSEPFKGYKFGRIE
jgi:predicted GIY-YIG superfamily endonuclease